VYEDAVRKRGLQKATTDPTARPLGSFEFPSNLLRVPPMPGWEWQGRGLVHRPRPEETGGVFTTTSFRFPALAAPVGLLIVAWFLIGLAVWLTERRGGNVARVRRIRRLAIVALSFIVLALAAWRAGTVTERMRLFPALSQVGRPPGPVYFNRAGFSRLKLDRDTVAALLPTDGDQRLATEILQAAMIPAGSADSLYLGVVSDPEVVLDDRTSGLTIARTFPLVTVHREYYARRPDFGEPGATKHPAGIVIGYWSDQLTFVWPSHDADRSTLIVIMNLELIGLVIVGLWIAGWLTWYILIGSAKLRSLRRHARGLCPQCGYPVVIGKMLASP
jgi:hypothetical protein